MLRSLGAMHCIFSSFLGESNAVTFLDPHQSALLHMLVII